MHPLYCMGCSWGPRLTAPGSQGWPVPSDPAGTPGFCLSPSTSISSEGKFHGTAAPSLSLTPRQGNFFAAGDLSNAARKDVEAGGNNLPG